ncbi:TetR/AcrR family transcriptional regulator [Archangium minus]|uniref:TetR/AcrR family transcriptional regulator n=1 Tax=Archangium minus TaxID=83450 RepID=A0ABY9WZU9_9BACT|nr:TetR/AcrR family transcriptional regulator [Archangium minus]
MPPRDRTKRRVAPRQERARASVEAILTAAEMVLRDEGFARATTNRIAARAGVNVALVYRYFAGKEAIVGALIERVANTTYDAVRRALAENALEPLPVALRAMFDALVHPPGIHPALHRELVEHVDITKRRQLVHDVSGRAMALFASFLEERSAELRALPDFEAAMFVLQHAIEASTHAAAFYRPGSLSVDRALDALTELVVRGLLPLPEPGGREFAATNASLPYANHRVGR